MTQPLLWASRAWIEGTWRNDVLLRVGGNGCWAEVQANVPAPESAVVLAGPVLPGLVDAHSHAFQRAFAGLAERLDPARGAPDDFWSWRDRMYGVALRITPHQMRAVATQLYTELLRGGYTQVCEFHYLHHGESGAPYPDPLAMSRALAEAAVDAGIGLTLLPVLYQRAGFSQPTLRDEQRRFATSVAQVLALRDGLRALGAPLLSAGVAVHSLRAVPEASLRDLVRQVDSDRGPLHIHVAEQTAEVDDCLAATGMRPIEWLARELPLDARWHLVHATHALPSEIDIVAASGAGVVLCPSTEANLGDGLADLPRWLDAGTPLSLGSDSQVCRHWPEELRWLEYGQRLRLRRRNVAAQSRLGGSSTAAHLFSRMLAGGASAAGIEHWGLTAGARADLLVINASAPGLLGVPDTHTLDALVFASDAPAFSEVWVAGQHVVKWGAHVQARAVEAGFVSAMHALWR